MDFAPGFLYSLLSFLVVLTVLVFVHELGHYWVARRNNVRVEVFSIGFGREIFGWTDKSGTRWKISWLPLGGYVKFYGDATAASTPAKPPEDLSPEQRAVSFHHKRLGQRAAIVAAGPLANFIFAIVVLAGLFSFVGQPYTPPDVGAVQENSAAAEAGFQAGDRITQVNGRHLDRFEELQQIVRMSAGAEMTFVVERDGVSYTLAAIPRAVEITDRFGNKQKIGLLGISRSGVEYVKRNPVSALWYASKETLTIVSVTLKAIGQMIIGERSGEEIGGPIRIAQMSGQMAQEGVVSLVWFMAVLSINLGLINFFPIPLLDGGHLLFYFFEALRGKPLADRVQEYGFKIGLALVLTLMVFATWNDLNSFPVIEFFTNLLS